MTEKNRAIPDGLRLLKKWRRREPGTIIRGWNILFAELAARGIGERYYRNEPVMERAVAPAPARTALKTKKRAIDAD